MTTFDDKEKGAENKYAHDKELEFKVHARSHKMLGLWAAGKMGYSGAKAEEYATSIITLDMTKHDPHHLVEKIKNDLLAHEIHVSDHDIRAEMYRAEGLAREQVLGN